MPLQIMWIGRFPFCRCFLCSISSPERWADPWREWHWIGLQFRFVKVDGMGRYNDVAVFVWRCQLSKMSFFLKPWGKRKFGILFIVTASSPQNLLGFFWLNLDGLFGTKLFSFSVVWVCSNKLSLPWVTEAGWVKCVLLSLGLTGFQVGNSFLQMDSFIH